MAEFSLRLRNYAVYLACLIGGTFRQRFMISLILHVVAVIQRYFPGLGIERVKIAFDPNMIRKKTRIKLRPAYCSGSGLLGEKYLLNINDHIGWHIFINGYYDLTPVVIGIALDRWLPLGTVIDVGANIGSTSIGLALKGISVIGIEASPSVMGDLCRNISLNSPIPYTPVNVAVTSSLHERSEVFGKIYSPIGNEGASSLIPNWSPSNSDSRMELVRLSTLDAIINLFVVKKVSLIKLDVEGLEYEAIQGLTNTLSLKPTVIFEWRPDVMKKSQIAIRDLRPLFPCDYQFYGVNASLVTEGRSRYARVELSKFSVELAYSNVMGISKVVIDSNDELLNFVTSGRTDVALNY